MKTDFTPHQLEVPATASSEAELRRCVRCGFCNATCPTYLLLGDERDSPRGRIYAIKDMLENEKAPTAEVVTHIDRCLSCLSCVTTCPSGVNYGRLIDHARAYVETHYRRPLIDRLYRRLLGAVLPFPGRLRTVLSLARLAKPLASLLAKVPGLKPAAVLLRLTPWQTPERPGWLAVYPPLGVKRGRVAILQGCVEPVLRPEIRTATIRLLTRMGLEVVFARGEACCGALVHHMGDEAGAIEAARRNVEAWSREAAAGGLDAIVVTASGCGTSLKTYGHLLRNDAEYGERAAQVSGLALDISEVIARYGLPPVTHPRPRVVAYQSACSLQHGQGVRDLPAELLAQAGYLVRKPAEAHICCGSAGVYNVLQPEIAGQLKARKLAALATLEPHIIASGNIGCLTQLSSAKAPLVHTVELLDWATGGPLPSSIAARL